MWISGFLALKASANGFGLADQDAFATARGEAFTATADNPSAIYFNPAGITQLEGSNVRGGLYGLYFQPSFTPPSTAPNSGHTYYSSDDLAVAPQLFYTFNPTNIPVSFGLGLYSPYGGNMSWPQDTGFRTVALSGSLQYITINPVVAIKVLPSLSIGGGVMVNYAKMNLNQGLRPFYLPPNTNFFRFNGNGWSIGYNAGILWKPIDQLSFGASYRSSASVNLEGQTEFEQQPILSRTNESAGVGFTFPQTITGGVSYRPTPKWNLEVDASYTDWSSFGTVTIHQSPPPFPVKQNIPVALDWQPSWMYEFGVTRYFDNGWHVSAGYVYDENSVPNAYYTPLAADLNRNFFSIGAGYQGKTFNCDIAYQFGYAPTHTVTGSTPSSTPGLFAGQNADGNYGFTSQAVTVSVGMHF